MAIGLSLFRFKEDDLKLVTGPFRRKNAKNVN